MLKRIFIVERKVKVKSLGVIFVLWAIRLINHSLSHVINY